MTTVITRLFEKADTAKAVAAELEDAGLPKNTIDIIEQTGEGSAAERIGAARVPDQRPRDTIMRCRRRSRAVMTIRSRKRTCASGRPPLLRQPRRPKS